MDEADLSACGYAPLTVPDSGYAGSVKVGARSSSARVQFFAGTGGEGGMVGSATGAVCASFGDNIKSARLMV